MFNAYIGAALRRDAPKDNRAKSEHVVGTHWIWLDFDEAGAAEVAEDRLKAAGLAPTFTVITGRQPGLRLQCWLRLTEMIDGATAQRLMKLLVNALGADPNPTDPARVMRLAGSISWPKPNKPGRVRELVALQKPSAPPVALSVSDIEAAIEKLTPGATESLPGAPAEGAGAKPAAQRPDISEEEAKLLIDALREAPNTLNRDDWVKLGNACKWVLGEDAREAWIEFSERYEKAKPGDAERFWDTANPNGSAGIGTIRRKLQASGFEGPLRVCPVPEGRPEDFFEVIERPVSDADPVDLWGSFDPPELPQGLLPPIIEDFARVNGAQMGADPAGLAVAALVTCAAAIPDKVQIKVKRHGDWRESARLWAALVGPPSAKKSPVLSAATAPLCRIDVEMMREWQKRVAEYEALSKEEKKGKQRPLQTRLRIEDATVEAAQMVLEGSPDGVLCLQDELSGFFGAMDKYNGGKGAQADRAFWLRSFNGGQFALNRVGRGAAIIDNLSISMLGGIQPEPLRKIAGDTLDDGLLQRLFPIMLCDATMGKDEPAPPVNDRYSALIQALHRLRPPGDPFPVALEFDDGAQAIRRDLEARHLELQSLETVNRKLASHVGKYDGMFARLCVVWHCIEHAGQDLPAKVTQSTAQRVADFLHGFLLRHALAFYRGVLGLSEDHDRLTALAGHILAHKLDRITNRDVQRGDRTMRGLTDQEIRPLLEQLAALGWLDRLDPPRPSSPPHWKVNPAVHARFAERGQREAQRRQKARQVIQQLAGGQT
jgi:hypothetical protein